MSGEGEILLIWHRFDRMTKACKEFHASECVYVIADPKGIPLYIGSSQALGDRRYRGGTASSFDAALHGSGNLIFVSKVPSGRCAVIEKALIWAERPEYNKQGKIIPLSSLETATFIHQRDVPAFSRAAVSVSGAVPV